ncbi:MAG TPA: hypothetical protein VLL54_02945 [Pyrinomonadaceae bacterium]|nr:hypothetical protein [Pyrinomonadaceae bacterium]
MKRIVSVLLVAFFGLALVSTGTAKTRTAPAVNGVYENFTVGAGSGDLEGMRVVLFTAHDEHYAVVQIAQGGAEDPVPEFVKATVNGTKVEFTVGSETYTGNVSAAGLRINGQLLRRKPCANFFR